MAGAMARDYKHAVAGAKTGRKTSTRSRKRGDEARQGSSMSFISGLGAGLLVAFVALLYGEPLRNQLNNMIPVDSDSGVGAAPQQRDALAEAPDYRFYKILPEMEVTVPDWELEPGPSRAAPAPKQGNYVLQVGSFRRLEVAEAAKAKLALEGGIAARIQQVVINGQEVWFRVHVGPFSNTDDVAAMRARLGRLDMEPLTLRLGGGA